jgi:hypothetical protein
MNRTLSLSQDGDINSRENTAASAADGLRVGRRNRLGLGLHVRRKLTRRSLRSHRADLPLLLSRPDPSSHRPSCSSTARAIAPRTWSTPGSISPRKRKPSCWLRSCPATPNSRMPPLASSAAWLRTRVRSLASTRSACICSEIRVGGYLAFDGAMFESQYFAAVAVHANRIADEYTGILARAQRKTPIGDLYRRSRPVFHRCQRGEDPRPPAQVRISRALCRTDKS